MNRDHEGSARDPLSQSTSSLSIAILGGTGPEGRGLAYRWARAGHRVCIGSRTVEKARAAAAELNALPDKSADIEGNGNLEAAEAADIIVLTVPFSAHAETLEAIKAALQGKLLIDVTVPLVPPRKSKVQMPPAGSAAQEARQIVGEGVDIAAAFQNISHNNLMSPDPIECDVLVTGTSPAARSRALQLVADAGLRGWDAGPLENSVVVEGLTSVLIGINKKYGSTRAGIKITGVPGS
ncbi:MAG: NADPH-dependent F420 reductase [Bacteroidota bacterium]